jgi:large repetitive protein
MSSAVLEKPMAIQKTYLLGASVILLAVVGCAGSATSTSDTAADSTVQGTLALTSFPATPDSVEAVDESGTATSTEPADDGTFSLALPEGHSYTIDVKSGSDSEPVVFARKDGSLTKKFDVTSGSATVDLGTVRHFDQAPDGGFSVRGTDAAASDCEDGVVVETGAACVDDDTAPVCDGDQGDHDGDKAGDGDGDGDQAEATDQAGATDATEPADEADVTDQTEEADATDQANSTDGTDQADSADPVDPSKPMAIPEHNIPDQLGGCGDKKGKHGDGDGDGDGPGDGDGDGDASSANDGVAGSASDDGSADTGSGGAGSADQEVPAQQ